MIIGTPKEITNHEYRVGMAPAAVHAFVARGHEVIIEAGAGRGSGIKDGDFTAAGARIVPTKEDVYGAADMIIKVAGPLPPEYPLLRTGQVLCAYLHLAPDPEQTEALLESGCIAIACETVQLEDGSLPLLTPMSEVAGRLSIQTGAHFLETTQGGRGVLLSGVPGTAPAKVVIVGGGVVGANAARIALALGARVTILDVSLPRLRYLDDIFRGAAEVVASSEWAIWREITDADLVVGCVLLAGARTPQIISREMLPTMKEGSVIVDVAIDQGGCAETSHPTTPADPSYVVDEVIHYCVANMPGAVARTSTFALTNVVLPYGLELADLGVKRALLSDQALLKGLNVIGGRVVCPPVAEALGYECHSAAGLVEELL